MTSAASSTSSPPLLRFTIIALPGKRSRSLRSSPPHRRHHSRHRPKAVPLSLASLTTLTASYLK